ncbi:hypothetical protein COO60DRAFT_99914 [Scenedesmus sp. NREL 46B-D3]|nr:hypothetical protein COO60DRAFT_99914 [Scenedesmus sp. NREL 46B-D3]
MMLSHHVSARLKLLRVRKPPAAVVAGWSLYVDVGIREQRTLCLASDLEATQLLLVWQAGGFTTLCRRLRVLPGHAAVAQWSESCVLTKTGGGLLHCRHGMHDADYGVCLLQVLSQHAAGKHDARVHAYTGSSNSHLPDSSPSVDEWGTFVTCDCQVLVQQAAKVWQTVTDHACCCADSFLLAVAFAFAVGRHSILCGISS